MLIMGTIRIQHVTVQFGPQVVLEDVSFDLHSGETVALVGANGVGKTTLFRLIDGHLTPDAGTVTLSKGLEVGYLSQEPDLAEDGTLREVVGEGFAALVAVEQKLQSLSEQMATEHDSPRLSALMDQYDRVRARFEAAGGYRFEQRLNEVLGGLGFLPADYDLPIWALSGGQRCRAALGKLLLQERQFLLLDEPTNHLDIDAVRWLEKFLAGYHGGAAIISHDRYLLDRLADRTIEVVGGGVTRGGQVSAYSGNYTSFLRTRETHRLTQERQYERDREAIQREQAFIAKHLAGQRTKEAQGRRKRLERRLKAGEFTLERPSGARTLGMRFGEVDRKPRQGTDVLRVEGSRKQYGDKLLFSELDLNVQAGERIGITGPNGTGKTTLLRIILGQVPADAGQVYVGPAVRIGYFAQEPDGLDPERTIVEEICEVRPDFLERDARDYAARFLFTGEDPFKRVGQLSGGEQSRVRFMKLILSVPDVLVLDEPTNHLDIPSREALEDALDAFPGTVVTVSHDRYFLDRVVDKLLVMRLGDDRLYQGNYSAYIEQVEQARAAEEAARQAARDAEATGRRGNRPARRRTAAGQVQATSPLRKLKLDELEAYITEREEKIALLEQRFGEAEVYKDPEKIMALRADFDTLSEELAAAEAVWLERAERA